MRRTLKLADGGPKSALQFAQAERFQQVGDWIELTQGRCLRVDAREHERQAGVFAPKRPSELEPTLRGGLDQADVDFIRRTCIEKRFVAEASDDKLEEQAHLVCGLGDQDSCHLSIVGNREQEERVVLGMKSV